MARIGNKTWYLIKNIVMALLFLSCASASSFVDGEAIKIVLYLLGGLFVVSALFSFKDMGLRVIPVALIGIGFISLADYLISNFDAMKEVTRYISGGLLILVAFFQFNKRRDDYVSGIAKLLPYLYPALLIVGVVFNLFPSLLPNGVAAKISASVVALGIVGWILYTLLVIRSLKGTSTKSADGGKSSGGKGVSSGGGRTIATISDVRKAMESVANGTTGGIETLGSGTNIYFSTSVSVYEGEINFKVNGDVRGTSNIKTQSDLDGVTGRIESVVRARQKRVMELARKKMDKLITDVDYTINVNVGNITQDD
ncbi:MAG: hypothetical protein K2M47_07345 [Clostridiales bacterium]|nr:hypothetical protein [Clostridiales bacterium]